MTTTLDQAMILAAGNGDRFRNGSAHSKLVTPVAGIPLLVRTLLSARAAGITEAHIVLGYDANHVRALAVSQAPAGLTLHFHLNPDWHEENGRSVLQPGKAMRGSPFAILMGDHIFDPRALELLIRAPRRRGEVLVGIDRHTTHPGIVSEATRVRTSGDRVTAIGKRIDPFDGLDTGLFVCDESIFAALRDSCAGGDTTLSGGIARLAARRRVRAVDIGLAGWCDVDTIGDLTLAEMLAAPVPAA